jgi:hypothetical protein
MQRLLTERDIKKEAYDASDHEAVKKAEVASKLRAEQRRALEANLLNSQPGREWLWQILAACHTWDEQIVVTNGLYEQGFWNGQRQFGLELMRHLARSSPENFARMMHENDR